MMELWGEREEKKEKVCELLTQMDATNIPPHRMFEIPLLGNILFF